MPAPDDDPAWPRLAIGERHWRVAPGSPLLDALNQAGLAIPYSCRAGVCQACRVRCLEGEPEDAAPDALEPAQRAAGWRLACQCRVVGDLRLEPCDPRRDNLAATVQAIDWLAPTVVRLRLSPERPLRYAAGQHVLLARDAGLARPYSLASLPGEDPWLEFHLAYRRTGAFSRVASALRPGDRLWLGPPLGGALRYEADWQEEPLWLLAAGTGLAPLWSVLRDALRQGHRGPIRLVHLARPGAHYLAESLHRLAGAHGQLVVDLAEPDGEAALLDGLRQVTRHSRVLLCGPPVFVEALSRRLYLAGLPRSRLLTEAFLPRVD